jgi:butyryl-CoA dehydrogenase
VDAVLDLAEEVATEHFAPHNRASDLQEPVFDGERVHLIPEIAKALEVFARTGIVGAAMDESVGGLQLPQTVAQACFLWFQAANTATAAYPFLTIAAANLLTAHGSPEQVAQYVPPMVEGRYFGTMCLSEPQAGSSLAGDHHAGGAPRRRLLPDHRHQDVDLRRRARPRGEHHPPGARQDPRRTARGEGASRCSSCRGSCPTAPATTSRSPGSTTRWATAAPSTPCSTWASAAAPSGHLVGEPHRGLTYMFHMMNEARVGVGAGAAALGTTGYLHALDHARTRVQGGRPIVEHADVARMLLAQKSYAEGAVALGPVLRTAARRGAHRGRPGPGPPAARRAHAHRQELAVAVVRGRQRPRHPGARRLRLHPRPPRRAVLPDNRLNPDPRGHPRASRGSTCSAARS